MAKTEILTKNGLQIYTEEVKNYVQNKVDNVSITHPTITKSTDSTSTATATHGGTITMIDSVTRDSNGHVTKINTKTVTLPSDNNTDTKATQTNTTTDADYRVVLSTNANDTTETNGLRKSTNFRANPATGAFFAAGYDRNDMTGQTKDLNDITLSHGNCQIVKFICKTSGGSNNISNIPVASSPFILDVELIRWASTTDYVTKQTFVSVGDKHKEYVRYCTSGTWETAWTKRLFTDNNTTYSVATTSANGLMSSTDKTKLDGIAANANAYTHPSYTARTGKPTANQTPAFGGTATVSQITSDATGHVTGATDRTITIPSTLSNGNGTAGLIKTSSTVTSNSGYTACPVISGVPYYKDTNTTYSVATTSANGLMSKEDKTKLGATNVAYATCSTEAATSAKVATIDGNSNWVLDKGSIVIVKFSVRNTASNVTLNVNSTGAKSIWYNTSVYTGNSSIVGGDANKYTSFMYDGTNWVWIGQSADANTTYSNMTAATSSAAGKAGLVPAPAAGAQAKYLRGDGTWQTPTNTTYSNFVKSGSGAAAGLVPAPSTTAGTTKYLREDGTWQVPPTSSTSVVNDLTSTSTTAALSANQGRILNNKGEHGYSLIISQTVASQSQSNMTTYSSRSFQDYDFIVLAGCPAKYSFTHTMILPTAAFRNTSYTFQLPVNASGSQIITLKFVNNTTVSVSINSGTGVLEIWGFKMVDKTTV